MATVPSRHRPRCVSLRDGREVTVRAIVEADAPEIVQAFERLSAESRYYRFMRYKKKIDDAALEHGVHPQPGREFAFVATIPAADGIDIVCSAYGGNNSMVTCGVPIVARTDWPNAVIRHAARQRSVGRQRR